jgi:NAD(P)H-hydrate epimerase
MLSIDQSDILFSEVADLSEYSAVAIGPGIGCRPNSQQGLHKLLEDYNQPIVIDADAINILGEHREWIELIPENSILTPHPKEFERFAGKTGDHYERNQLQIELAKKYRINLVLKGAYSAVATSGGDCYFNSTGNPGMATAGSGDVLTGIILSLLAQGYKPDEAAILGVFIHGLAGDKAKEKRGEESLIASDITEYLGEAFNEIRNYAQN